MWARFSGAMNWVGTHAMAFCVVYGLMGICLGMGAFGYGVFHDIMIFGLGG